MNGRILFVDDDPRLLASFQTDFRTIFEFDTALSGAEALEYLQKSSSYAVIVSGMSMPGMNGLELLDKVRQQFPQITRVMLTRNADQHTVVEAVNCGQIFRFIRKPCPTEDLVQTINAALKAHKIYEAEHHLLAQTLAGCVKVLVEILGTVSPDSLGRGQKFRDFVHPFALFVKAEPGWEIELGALLSPIGYASMPSSLLTKIHEERSLSTQEITILDLVPKIGHDLLIAIPRLKGVAEIVLHQNQHFDGTGYPVKGRTGKSIPIGARLLKIIADRSRLERDGVAGKKAHEAMKLRSGAYDPVLLEQCFLCFPEVLNHAIAAEQAVMTLSVSQLRVGHVIVTDINTREGLMLLRGGSRLTEMMLQRLNNYHSLGDVQEPVLVHFVGEEKQEKPLDNLPDFPAGG